MSEKHNAIPESRREKKSGAGKSLGSKATQFKPGVSGNPGGYSLKKRISDVLRHRVEAGGAEELADLQWKLTQSKKPNISLQAINDIADRTEGRPTQGLRIEPGLSPEDARRLTNLAVALGLTNDTE